MANSVYEKINWERGISTFKYTHIFSHLLWFYNNSAPLFSWTTNRILSIIIILSIDNPTTNFTKYKKKIFWKKNVCGRGKLSQRVHSLLSVYRRLTRARVLINESVVATARSSPGPRARVLTTLDVISHDKKAHWFIGWVANTRAYECNKKFTE